MDLSHLILLAAAGFLVVALLLSWNRRIQEASTRNVNDHEREMLRRASRDTERLNIELREAIGSMRLATRGVSTMAALPVKTPKQSDRQPARKKAAQKR